MEKPLHEEETKMNNSCVDCCCVSVEKSVCVCGLRVLYGFGANSIRRALLGIYFNGKGEFLYLFVYISNVVVVVCLL